MNPPEIWVLSDVDDTLVTTVRQSPSADAEPCAFDERGGVTSWLTAKQKALLELLSGATNFVPVSARTTSGISRVNLPPYRYAIVSFGGVIRLADGSSEPRFHALMEAEARRHAPVLDRLLAVVQDTCAAEQINARARVVEDDGLKLFLSIKHNQRSAGSSESELLRLKEVLGGSLPQGGDWLIHSNGNFIAVLPPRVRKEFAAGWLKETVIGRDALVLGAGDSLTDLPFMALCDLAVSPVASQIFSKLIPMQNPGEED